MSINEVYAMSKGIYQPTEEEIKKYLQYRVVEMVKNGVYLEDTNTERTDSIVPIPCPQGKEEWMSFYTGTDYEWVAAGMIQWDYSLWLFPKEWFNELPVGMPVYNVAEQDKRFHLRMSQHYIEGALGFGLIHETELLKRIMDEDRAASTSH